MKRKLLLALFGILFCSAVLAGPGDDLGLSPFWKWKELETERFRITYPESLEEQAKLVAQHYENAHETLKTELNWEPAHKVQVLITDGTDAANGMTAPFARFGMILYLTPPETWFSTNYYEDWLKLLVYHEYTHYLNMDPTRDVYSLLRVLFGDVLLPNMLLPPWMLEGYAVYFETKYTKAGRGRSPFYSMVVRSLVQDGMLDSSKSVTLDRVASGSPHAPGGEVPYLFGYMLTNEASKEGPNVLTDLTTNSSQRLPYFINGNLENITGKDWYALWDRYVAAAKTRAEKDLQTLRTQPISKVDFFEETSDDALGVASSPDLQWLAYRMGNEDRWETLYLKNLTTGKTTVLEDKFMGVGMAFTPDSKRIISSSLNRRDNFHFYSDLKVFEIETGKSYFLTEGARAKDPTLSPDGNQIAYIVTENSSNDLYIADLSYQDSRLVLSHPKKIVDANILDRISNPKFSADGKSIVYTFKQNGQMGENLMAIDSNAGNMRTLVADGARNRFPAVDSRDNLYFVSDKTGVDNLYRYDMDGKSTQVTNVTTGLWLPVIRGEEAIASVYRGSGFGLAKVELNPKGFESETLKIAEPDAPAYVENKVGSSTKDLVSHDYSPWKSLRPRQWAPLIIAGSESFYLGAMASSYDATFQHIYSATLATDTQVRLPDFSFYYANRMFGPSFDFSGSITSNDVIKQDAARSINGSFTRERNFGLGISYPFIQTVGRIIPRIGFNWEQDQYYTNNNHDRSLVGKSRLVPTQDVSVSFGNARSSRYGVWSETGQFSFAGVRRYDLSGPRDSFKLLANHQEFFHLGRHFVLSPQIRAVKVSRVDRGFYDANVNILGREKRTVNPFPGDAFDEVHVRGYPNTFIGRLKSAYTLSADLRFPLAEIFRGWGTNPFSVNQLFIQVFLEDTYLPGVQTNLRNLPSAGAGLRLSTEWLQYIPLTIALDYHQGFNETAIGEGELFFSVLAVSPLNF